MADFKFRGYVLVQLFYFSVDPIFFIIMGPIVHICRWRNMAFIAEYKEVKALEHFGRQFVIFKWFCTCIVDLPFVLIYPLSLHRSYVLYDRIKRLNLAREKYHRFSWPFGMRLLIIHQIVLVILYIIYE